MKMFTDTYLICGKSFLASYIILEFKKRRGVLRVLLLILLGHSFLLPLKVFAFENGFYHLAGIALLLGNGTGISQGPVIYFFCELIISGKSFVLHLTPYFLKVVVYSVAMTLQFIFGITVWYSDFELEIHKWSNLFDDFFFLIHTALSFRLIQKIRIWKAVQKSPFEFVYS